MKRIVVIATAVVLLAVIVLASFLVFNKSPTSKAFGDDGKFYVGVTYGGDSAVEAKLLVDKVKNYSNLFVLQSGTLMGNTTVVNEIGDYAVTNGLHFAAYFSALYSPHGATWIGTAQQRWGSMFAGIYYGDEPGGQMLDGTLDLTAFNGSWQDTNVNDRMIKNPDGTLTNGNTTYSPDGEVTVRTVNYTWPDSSFWNSNDKNTVFESNQTYQTTTYYPNGSITIQENYSTYTFHTDRTSELKDSGTVFFTVNNGSDRIAQVEPYQQVLNKNPISNDTAASEIFVDRTGEKINILLNQWQPTNRSFPVFTADYGLQWFDYKSGYDFVLAELGWNNSVAQEIGLVRGAANLQGKSWGTIITWKYNQAPYLPGGDEMFEQMRTSYVCGAKYVVVFNYAENTTDSFGTLKEEHFQALERFWREVVQNPDVARGSVKAEAAFVLPKNYGWGMRNAQDTVWGIWQPPQQYGQVWPNLQAALEQYGQKLDIIYETPAAGNYAKVIYWNQAG